MVEAPRYYPELRGFDPHDVIGNFHSHNRSGHILVLMTSHSVTELNNRVITWDVNAAVA